MIRELRGLLDDIRQALQAQQSKHVLLYPVEVSNSSSVHAHISYISHVSHVRRGI